MPPADNWPTSDLLFSTLQFPDMTKKFYQKFTAPKNSAVKEAHRVAKKKAKKERAAAINERFEAKRRKRDEAAQLAEEAKRKPAKGAGRAKSTAVAATPKSAGAAIVKKNATDAEKMPLNKFLAHGGICGRREAAGLVKEGRVKVNGVVVTEPAHRVSQADVIVFDGKPVKQVQELVYILLNKPKDYLTTTDDPEGRKTVLQLIKGATGDRVYPVGRLDRNTSGVLLLTNDGDLTQQLSHPSYEVKKVYEVRLDKPLAKTDFEKILSGIRLEDGAIKADALGYADARDKSVIGIEIHSGRNRIVRRIFESLGYDVKGLDRVMYAGLTKKNVERGKWRLLAEKEVRLLKYMPAPPKKRNPAGK
jgi:23S rRNA pseudouridine2605 synthase